MAASRIEHVVVLMLENRSFDSMLGALYPKSEMFDGLSGDESNPLRSPDGTVQSVRVWNDTSLSASAACIPSPDPGELFTDMNTQIFGDSNGRGEATMSGFVENFMKQPSDRPPNPRDIMHYFTPAQTPALSGLARSFAVSDRWFAAAPCETWPNRYFTHCGTAGGYVNNRRSRFPHRWPRGMKTIFRRLERAGRSWKVYFHDLPQAATLTDLWSRIPTHFCLFEEEFEKHAAQGRLANYIFIEPRYYPNPILGKLPNDQHPPHNILYGEQLIATIYNALRRAPTWDRTLFVITYDEHGGCYDHVPPPAAVSPGGRFFDGFAFDRYGVRVPTVIVSPFIPAGTIARPPSGSPPFDHCSIIATLEEAFDLGAPMTPRVGAAPSLLSLLTLTSPSNQGPEDLNIDWSDPSKKEQAAYMRRSRNGLQRSLSSPFTLLPAGLAKASAHIRRFGSRHSKSFKSSGPG
jgi:phospholipase C